jgi:hypothetical protein
MWRWVESASNEGADNPVAVTVSVMFHALSYRPAGHISIRLWFRYLSTYFALITSTLNWYSPNTIAPFPVRDFLKLCSLR